MAGGREPAATIAANFPVALSFAPDGRLFWAERSGTIRYWLNGSHFFATVPVSTSGERGLLGLALSPNFCQDHFVYAFGSDPNGTTQRILRFTESAGVGVNVALIVGGLPAGNDCCHKGGRIAFGPDGLLYVTLGDNHVASAAQDGCDLRGKVLRYRADGGLPGGNLCGAVFARGFRNPFGIAISPSGQILVTNNGPTGDAGSPSTGYDTIYDVVGGGNYQWPTCYGYSHPLNPPCAGTGPLWSSEASTVVPTGATYVSGAGPAGYAGHFVFCTYDSGGRVYESPTVVASVLPQCRLDIKESPSHALYYSDTGAIYSFVR